MKKNEILNALRMLGLMEYYGNIENKPGYIRLRLHDPYLQQDVWNRLEAELDYENDSDPNPD